MQPENTDTTSQNNEPQAVPAAAPSNQNQELISKKIRNAGHSITVLGIFMVVIGAISVLGVSSLEEDSQALTYGYLALVIFISLFWAVKGVQITKSTDASVALAGMKVVMMTALVLVGVTVLGMVLNPGGGGLAGILALLLAAYLGVAVSGLKKLSAN